MVDFECLANVVVTMLTWNAGVLSLIPCLIEQFSNES